MKILFVGYIDSTKKTHHTAGKGFHFVKSTNPSKIYNMIFQSDSATLTNDCANWIVMYCSINL